MPLITQTMLKAPEELSEPFEIRNRQVCSRRAQCLHSHLDKCMGVSSVSPKMSYEALSDAHEYDHLAFPGVVPRTFVGPIVVSGIAYPIVALSSLLGFSKFFAQYVVRAVLGLLVIFAWRRFRKQLELNFGQSVTIWFTLITASQFHFMYYLSRPLPNTFALVSALLAFSYWLEQKHAHLIWACGVAVLIFRSELCLLLGPMLLADLSTQRLQLLPFLKTTIPAGLCCLGTTITIDSLFWGRLLWPEGEVFWFNTYKNQSGNWGSSPILWYWYSALPRAMASSLFLVPFGVALDKRLQILITPCVIFVCLYSLLPHKELRFIIYIFPILNAAAAKACHFFWVGREKSGTRQLVAIGCALHLVVNAAFTTLLLTISGNNYPGGMAMMKLHKLIPEDTNVYLHIDNFAAQTGVSRFTQLNDHWRYNKTEHLKAGSRDMRSFSHLLVEAKSKYSYNLKHYTSSHEVLSSVEAFSHLSFNYQQFPPVKVRVKPALFILKNLEEDNVDWSWIHSSPEDVEEAEELMQQESSLPAQTVGSSQDGMFEPVQPEEQEQYLFTKATDREVYESRMGFMDGNEDEVEEVAIKETRKIRELETGGGRDEEDDESPPEPRLPETGCFRPEGGVEPSIPEAEEDTPEVPTQSQMSQSVKNKEGSPMEACSQCTAGDDSVPDNLVSQSSAVRNGSDVRKKGIKDVTDEGQGTIHGDDEDSFEGINEGNKNYTAEDGSSEMEVKDDTIPKSNENSHFKPSIQKDGVNDMTNSSDENFMHKEEHNEESGQTSHCEGISIDKSSADAIHIDGGVQSNSCNDIPSDITDQQSEVSGKATQVFSIYREGNIDTYFDDDDDDDNNNNDNDDDEYKSTGDTSSHSNVDKTNPIHNDIDENGRQIDIDLNEGYTDTHHNVRSNEPEAFSSLEIPPDNGGMAADEKHQDDVRNYIDQVSGSIGDNTFVGIPSVEEEPSSDGRRVFSGVDSTISFKAENREIYVEAHDSSDADNTQRIYEPYEDAEVPLPVKRMSDMPHFDHNNLVGDLSIAPNIINQMEDENDEQDLFDESTIYIDDPNIVADTKNLVNDIEEEGISVENFADASDEYFYDPRIFIEDSDDERNLDTDETVIEDADEDSLDPDNEYFIEDIDDENSVDTDENIGNGVNEENIIDDADDGTVIGTDDEMAIENTENESLKSDSDYEYIIEDTDNENLEHLSKEYVIDADDEIMDDDLNTKIVYETDEESVVISKRDLLNDRDNFPKVERENPVGGLDNADSVTSRKMTVLDSEIADDILISGHQNTVAKIDGLQADMIKPPLDNRNRDQGAGAGGGGTDHLKDQGRPTKCNLQCSNVDESLKSSDRKTEDDELVKDDVRISHDSTDGHSGVINSLETLDGSGLVVTSDSSEEEDTVVRKSSVSNSKVSDEAVALNTVGGSVDDGSPIRNRYTNKVWDVHDYISNSIPEIDPELPVDQEEMKTISPEDRPVEDSQTEDQSEEEGGKETRFVEVTLNLEENEPNAGVSEVSAKDLPPEPKLTPLPVREGREDDSEHGNK